MEDKLQNQDNDHLPIYNIKAVSSMLNLLPVTLRAWERRYGIPSPSRGDQGYRLYSPYDVRLLQWLKHQNDNGMSIGQAVKYLHELQRAGNDPALESPYTNQEKSETSNQVSLETLSRNFEHYLINFHNEKASEILRRAFSIYSVDQVLTEVVQTTLVHLGEKWHNGEISIAVEHFATQFCEQQLLGMFNSSAVPTREEIIFAACAPGEMHQIGILSLIVILRWRGWDVKYFGPNLSFDRILETLNTLKPKMILLSSTMKESALATKQINQILEKITFEKPIVILGGNAFQKHSEIINQMPGEVINSSLNKTVEIIETKLYRKSMHLKS
jgi:methanogenic corrinoid protein MtbC1